MELSKLINGIHAIQVAGEVERKDINGIFYDSRMVKRGSLFVAIEGFATDGHRFIQDAISRGASAVIIQNDSMLPEEIFRHANVTKILVRDSRTALAEAARAYYKEPSSRLRLIGCSGTNGKTTVTWLMKHLLEGAGYSCGLFGTIANFIGQKQLASTLTTPESCDVNALLSEMIDAGCSYAVMEVSSHAVSLGRIRGLEYAAAVFTNLTQDHLDYHGSMENYRDAKKSFYDGLSGNALAVSNLDDPNGEYMISGTGARKLFYGAAHGADVRISNISFDFTGTAFTLAMGGREYDVRTKLFGEFNAYNAAAALAVCANEGIPMERLLETLRTLPQVPGRFEQISRGGKTVIVDYAHTPDSLEKTLLNIRAFSGNSRPIVSVFGCGGNRDKGKRPLMGKIAAELSTSVIITSDNPREEDPEAIIRDIVQGIDTLNFVTEPDRKTAIMKAIQDSASNAIILLAGKGHEDYQIIGKEKIHLSDQETAAQFLEELPANE